jgi:hypothetical protein
MKNLEVESGATLGVTTAALLLRREEPQAW